MADQNRHAKKHPSAPQAQSHAEDKASLNAAAAERIQGTLHAQYGHQTARPSRHPTERQAPGQKYLDGKPVAAVDSKPVNRKR
jgi:hypothetical protein